MNEKEPAISVIIPMYNSEIYIRQCLVSVLTQKLQDFEAIVIDDCSTDGSIGEVEKLMPHFDGRLQLLKRDTNAGGAALPRNEALKLARGKYVVFLDADDMLIPEAFTILFNESEQTGADVLHLEKFFLFNDDGTGRFDAKEMKIATNESRKAFVKEAVVETNDLSERIRLHCKKRFYWSPCIKTFRRDLLIDNKIEFTDIPYYEDLIFCFKCLCHSKRYVRVPYVVNIIRVRPNSASKIGGGDSAIFTKWLKVFIDGINAMDEFMRRFDFFKQNPKLRHKELQFFTERCFETIGAVLKDHPEHEIFNALLQRLQLNPHGLEVPLAYFISTAKTI